MVRTSQIARDSPEEPIRWIQRDYVDHQGNPVILGKVASYTREFYQPEQDEIEAYRIQPPFLEIYSYKPSDGLACVEHQRREVAYRKRLHQQEGKEDESLPPLIPTMQTSFKDQFMSGFCFLLTSKSYLKGAFRDNNHGTGPWWISFDRSLPPAEWGIAVYPEIRDITVKITVDQCILGFDIKDLMTQSYSVYVYGQHDYGLHEPPPPTPSEENPTTQDIQQILEQQQQTADVQSIDSNILRLTWRSENKSVTVTNSADKESDIQYVIYVPFLADINHDQTVLLETTARTFTTGIISHLPSKTIYFEFRIPGSSLSSLISAPPNGLDIGASHEFGAGSGTFIRVLPQSLRDFSFRPISHHYFTVVLDKPAFIQEPNIVIETHRSVGIQEAARKLGMLSVEENIQYSARKLTPEEHREMLSLSPEEYEQKMNF
ncbi:hypothetical protein N7532_009007 [Penicillium argentinense]|uniref:Uncharacterized protein n=1 Tax=Penicillium argentinense TaxID=1131581 RepID=A0A9W9EYJ0_9EURO|nr:uncharacterized protein N7532_009007 [Penicillium argentinense]KAJ5090323.1 hypothetical protein N7532_009007 [Penicillium argentinense]